MNWQLHSVAIAGVTHNPTLSQLWQTAFASLPPAAGPADLRIELQVVETPLAPPDGPPHFRQGELLAYYVDLPEALVYVPRYGQVRLNLQTGSVCGQLWPPAVAQYGILEDMLAIALSPYLRRRGLYLIHAFAAALEDQAVLLVGDIGSGKTTTGLSLLNRGWKLLANDSPIFDAAGVARSYPGLLAAYPETLAHFAATRNPANTLPAGRKLAVAAEEIWPDVWREQAPIRAICFPQIEARQDHTATPLSPAETMRRLMPHTMEQWDQQTIPTHLRALRQLVSSAPGYELHLGPDVLAIPDLLMRLVAGRLPA